MWYNDTDMWAGGKDIYQGNLENLIVIAYEILLQKTCNNFLDKGCYSPVYYVTSQIQKC